MARQMRTEATRQRLLHEGVSILIEQGYHGTGVKEVLDKVGIPKGSFYNHFESKEQFGAEVIQHFAEQIFENMDMRLGKPLGDAFSALRGFFKEEIRRHDEEGLQGCLFGNLGAELGASKALCQRAMQDGLKGMEERFASVLGKAQEQGTVRSDITATDLASFLLNAYEGALLRMKVEGSVEPLRKFMAVVVEGFLRA